MADPDLQAAQTRLADRLRGIVDLMLALVQNRLSLIGSEVEVRVRDLLGVLALGAMALLFAAMALMFGAMGVIAALWETHRIAAVLGVTFFFLLCAGGCAAWAHRTLNLTPSLFALTRQELEADRQQWAHRHPETQGSDHVDAA